MFCVPEFSRQLDQPGGGGTKKHKQTEISLNHPGKAPFAPPLRPEGRGGTGGAADRTATVIMCIFNYTETSAAREPEMQIVHRLVKCHGSLRRPERRKSRLRRRGCHTWHAGQMTPFMK